MFKFISNSFKKVCESFTDLLTLGDIYVDESIHVALDESAIVIAQLTTTHTQRIAHLDSITDRRAGRKPKAAK
tara:strand:- start:1798 stop:2016 length:219 start_codon:yes stop_codon:yes gene_type:complete